MGYKWTQMFSKSRETTLFPDVDAVSQTTNVFKRSVMCYLCICVCACTSARVCLYMSYSLKRSVAFGCDGEAQTQMCAARPKRRTSVSAARLKPMPTLSPSDPRLEWLDKQVPFPNCVWRGNCARRAAAGPVAGTERVHFVLHTRRIWRADVLSAAIQLQTSSCTHIAEDGELESEALKAPFALFFFFACLFSWGGFWKMKLMCWSQPQSDSRRL